MPDWAFYRHSGIRASMHVHCPGPCCISKSILHVHVHVACSCQWCISCQCFMSMSMSIDIYIEMPECRTVRHQVSLVPDWKKLTMPKPVRYRTKLMQSGIFLVRYRTKIRDAGMPMPALVSSMPMPSYAFRYDKKARKLPMRQKNTYRKRKINSERLKGLWKREND